VEVVVVQTITLLLVLVVLEGAEMEEHHLTLLVHLEQSTQAAGAVAVAMTQLQPMAALEVLEL
jgi:hypothetical protein